MAQQSANSAATWRLLKRYTPISTAINATNCGPNWLAATSGGSSPRRLACPQHGQVSV